MDGFSGSMVLQRAVKHTRIGTETLQRQKQQTEQRLEMADNAKKRTRHPFSGYKQILFQEPTRNNIPPMKLLKPKAIPMATTSQERDQVMRMA
jgi:hypothetical protein